MKKGTPSAVRLDEVLVLFFLIFLGFLIYANTLEGPFVFDDKLRIEGNAGIRVTELNLKTLWEVGSGKNSAQSPWGNLTFALNYYFHRYEVIGYHLVNITIHILTGIFLFFLIRTTLRIVGKQLGSASLSASLQPKTIAFFASLLWLVHPVQTESVTYIVQRLNSMAAMFYVLAFLLYVKGRLLNLETGDLKLETRNLKPATRNSQLATRNPQPATHNSQPATRNPQPATRNPQPATRNPQLATRGHYIWFAGSALAWLLALGSKQNAAILPFFIFLYEWYFFQDLSKEWLGRHLKHIAGLMAVFGLIAFVYLGIDPEAKFAEFTDYVNKEFTLTERLLTQFRVVIYYLTLIFYPHPSRLNLDYDFSLSHSLLEPVTTVVCLILILGLVGLAVSWAKKERVFSFSILWFLGNLIIESSIIPLAIIFEHRVYLPSMLVIVMLVMLAFRYIRAKVLVVVGLSMVAGVCCLWTYQRNKVWGDEVTLWSDCVNKSPRKARPYRSLGVALAARGNFEEAIELFSEALRINPNLAEAHSNAGAALARTGKIPEAISHYNEALRLKSDSIEAHNNLGAILQREGRLQEAKAHYFESVRLAPDVAETHYNLGGVLLAEGDFQGAVSHFSEALRINPTFAEAHYNLGLALERQGRIKEGISHFAESLRLKPDFAQGQYHLGVVLLNQENLQEAVYHLSESIRIDPNYAEAHYSLGLIRLRQGKVKEAIKSFSEALRIAPKHKKAQKTLEALLQKAAEAEPGDTDKK